MQGEKLVAVDACLPRRKKCPLGPLNGAQQGGKLQAEENRALMVDSLLAKLEKFGITPSRPEITSKVAQHFQWTFVTGTEAAVAGPVLTMASDADKLGADVLSSSKYSKDAEELRASFSAMEKVPFSAMILDQCQVACGKLEGQDCFAFLHGKSHGDQASSEYLQVVVLLSRPLKFGLCVYPEQWTSRIGKRFFRMQDIEAGLQEFDEHFIVQAKREVQVGALLSRASVQAAFRPFMNPDEILLSEFVVNDVSVRGKFYNKSSRVNRAREDDRLTVAVQALESAAKLAKALSGT